MLKVGLILFSVRDEMKNDPIGTVEKVGKLGYKNIEVCNHTADRDPGCGFDISAEKLKETFDKFGSQVVSAHIFPVLKADWPAVFQYNKTLQNENIVNPNGKFSTYDDLMRQCEELNRVGKQCRENGFRYLYHNHSHEFRTFNGKSILDIMMENTDPEYLSLELDTFWVMRAGLDPVETLKHFGKRVRLVHQKDFPWDSIAPININGLTPEDWEMKEGESVGTDGTPRVFKTPEEEARWKRDWYIRSTSFTEIGTGIMRIQEIINAANEYTDAQYIILEQDSTRMGSQIESIEKSMEAFRKFSGISWDN